MKSAIQFIFSLVITALIILGIAGLSWNFFRPNGWLVHWVGRIWSLETHYIVMAVPVVIVAIFVARVWIRGWFATSKADSFANLLTYALALVGAGFVVKIVMHGTL